VRGGKIWLALVIVLSVGMIALPQTVSLFEGQHIWYDANDMNNQCVKCHADIATELQTSGEHSNFKCTMCHQVNKMTDGAHAAATVACTDCHTSVVQEFQNDVHLPYYEAANSNDMMTGPNEACIGCHTHADVNITFVDKTTLEFTAEALGGGQWNVTNMTAK